MNEKFFFPFFAIFQKKSLLHYSATAYLIKFCILLPFCAPDCHHVSFGGEEIRVVVATLPVFLPLCCCLLPSSSSLTFALINFVLIVASCCTHFYLIIESFFASTNYSLTWKQTIAYLPRAHYVTKLVFRAQQTTSYYYQISHIFAIVWVHSLNVFAKTLPAAHLALHSPTFSATSFEKVL